MKDPSEAATYLEEWKQSKQENVKNSNWKFNKNTQSWLIRHMYEADKVPKATFSLLLEYLAGLEGKTTRVWIRSEASRRALRYKQYEKQGTGKVEDEGKGTLETTRTTTAPNSKKETKESTEKAVKEGKPTNEEEREEQVRWEKLSDHDKRKEYKRARRVLESINE